MSNYKSKYTGAQIDEAVGLANTAVQDISGKQDVIADLQEIRKGAMRPIPTKVSELENDEGYAVEKNVNEKISELASKVDEGAIQLQIADSIERPPHGWGDNISFSKIEKNVEGDVISMYEVKVEKQSSTGNLFGFSIDDRLTENDLGERFNFYILLYSPIEVELLLSDYPDFSEKRNTAVKLKIGWNEILFSELVSNVDLTWTARPEVLFQEKAECIGRTFFVKCLFYKGIKKGFLLNLNNEYVKVVNGKDLIQNALIDKIENIDAEKYNYNMTHTKEISNNIGSWSGFYIRKENGNIIVRKGAGSGVDNGAWCYLNFNLDNGFYWKKNHKYYVALDILVREDSHSTSEYSRADLVPKFDNSHTVGSQQIMQYTKIGQRGIYKALITVDKENIDSYPDARRLYWQFGPQYRTDSVFDATVYNVCVYDLGEPGTEGYIDWYAVDNAVALKGIFPYECKVTYSVEAERTKKEMLNCGVTH